MIAGPGAWCQVALVFATSQRRVTGLIACVGMCRVRLRPAGTVVELRSAQAARRGAHGDRLRMRWQVAVTAAGGDTVITDHEHNTVWLDEG